VRSRLQLWQLALIAVAAFGVALGGLYWRQRSGFQRDARVLLGALPGERATTVYIDADLLRRSGILTLIAGSKSAEEPDYRRFVEQTGFDYRTDLDAVAASFTPNGSYFALAGRFQWPRLKAYALAQGGECRESVCNVMDGAGGRSISLQLLSTHLLALAVNPGPWGVMSVALGRSKPPALFPPEPVWISGPSSVAAGMSNLPLAAGLLLAPVAQADTVTLAFGPSGSDLQMRLEALCISEERAATVTRQLSTSLNALREAITKESASKELREVGGVLAAGKWEQRGTRVIGTWPLDRHVVEALAGGQLDAR